MILWMMKWWPFYENLVWGGLFRKVADVRITVVACSGNFSTGCEQ